MVDYALARRSRNVASNMVHVLLNLLLGVGAVLVTVLSNNPTLGLILVLASKWRVFAVRSRYIWLNFKSNLVDLIVGVSVVLIAYFSGAEFLPVHFLLMAFYSVWLLFIKPKSSDFMTSLQSLIAVFMGTSAAVIAVMMTNPENVLTLVIVEYIIGYAGSRHVLAQSDDRNFNFSTMICGLVFAEIAWLSHSWLIVYPFSETGIQIPQLSIVLTIFAFLYNYARAAMIKYRDDFRFKQIALPVIWGVLLIGVIVILFSNPKFHI